MVRLAHRCVPMLSLTDEEMSMLRELSEPIAFGRRREFLQAVAAELANGSQTGPGATYRVARDVQRRYVLEAQRVAPGDMPQGRARRAAEPPRARPAFGGRRRPKRPS
jgi:hypothetical protein